MSGERFKVMDALMKRSKLRIKLVNANAKMDLNVFGLMINLLWDVLALQLSRIPIN